MIKIHVDWAGQAGQLGGVVERMETPIHPGAASALAQFDLMVEDVRGYLRAKAKAEGDEVKVEAEEPRTVFAPDEFVAEIRQRVLADSGWQGRQAHSWDDLTESARQEWRGTVLAALTGTSGLLVDEPTPLDVLAHKKFLDAWPNSRRTFDDLDPAERRYWRREAVNVLFAQDKDEAEKRLQAEAAGAEMAELERVAEEMFAARWPHSIQGWKYATEANKQGWRRVAQAALKMAGEKK